MGNGQLVLSGDQGDNQQNIIRISPEIRRAIAGKSLLTCLFPAAILSLLTFMGTSWFLPDTDISYFIIITLVVAMVASTVAAVSVSIVCRQPTS